ncbi:sugar ABC transporter substrate-binding protein [Chitinibacter bivalviorum]|uniref:Sugar ABC transporter substrate-binding protein n=1 Tax=Chitinibacter bivalviorum TaxID=2739434 RepID=A0A7H9BEL3_9NEIS|nr:sugar ABC transporter substrate-binding protein [Chitinibacter bivalviorum]QLG86987.1 sugar ABC transporter substrate-binding protein [Chitinibacter bivalviorum]
MFKKTAVVSSLVAAGLLGAGAASAAPKIQLEYWTMSMAPTFSAYFTEVTKAFNAQNPTLEAKWVDMNWDQIQPKLIAAIASGKPPALVNFNVPWVHEFANQGNILPVDAYIDASKYQENAIKDVTVNGKIYAFPSYNSVSIIAYNKDILNKAGVNGQPKTYDEFIAQARVIKQKTGLTAFSPKLAPGSGGGITGWFVYAGLPVIKDGKAVFNSPQHVAMLNQFAQLYKEGVIPRDVFKMEFEQEISSYNSGRLAMMTTAPQALKRTQADAKKIYDVTDIAPFPVGAGKIAFGGWLMDFVIPKGAANPAEAGKLGAFITNDANQLAFSKATGTTFPSTKLAAKDGFFTEGAKSADPVLKGRAVAAGSIGDAKTLLMEPGILPDETTMMRVLHTEVEAAILGRKSAQAALDKAVADWNKRLAQKK